MIETATKNIKAIKGVKYYTGSHSKIRELTKKTSRPTEFGHKVWATSLVLIDFLSENNFNLKNKKILEVGCGLGLLGLYLVKHFQCDVICSDLDEKVLPIVQVHAELNLLSIQTKAQSFDEISDEDLKATDVIVGVEVCYSEEAAKSLNQMIKRAYKFGVKQIFIADPGRPDFLEIICKNHSQYNKELFKLEGTKNGKTTHLLYLSRSV